MLHSPYFSPTYVYQPCESIISGCVIRGLYIYNQGQHTWHILDQPWLANYEINVTNKANVSLTSIRDKILISLYQFDLQGTVEEEEEKTPTLSQKGQKITNVFRDQTWFPQLIEALPQHHRIDKTIKFKQVHAS